MVQKGHPAAGAIAIQLVLVWPFVDRILVVRIGRTGHGQGGHRRLGVRQTDRAGLGCGSSVGVAGAGADGAGAELVCCST